VSRGDASRVSVLAGEDANTLFRSYPSLRLPLPELAVRGTVVVILKVERPNTVHVMEALLVEIPNVNSRSRRRLYIQNNSTPASPTSTILFRSR